MICPKCNRKLTGSASKGKYDYYYYYHCSSDCGTRFKAEEVNALFEKELKKYIPRPGRIELYSSIILADFKNQSKAQDKERKHMIAELDKINQRMQNARVMKVDGELTNDDFQSLKDESNRKIEEL